MIFRILILFCLSLNSVLAVDRVVSFDLDETLISSNQLKKNDLKLAEGLGCKLDKTPRGQIYIVRPGAFELLDYCKSRNVSLILISANNRAYVSDILESSGLFKYFDKVITQEDLRSSANRDYQKYPNHRNLTYPQHSALYNHSIGFWKSYIGIGFQRLLGNSNLHPFIAHTQTAKYPPQYGSRIHVDNSWVHVDKPVDFVGIKVDDFLGLKEENSDWIKPVKKQIDIYLKHGWQYLYLETYKKNPVL